MEFQDTQEQNVLGKEYRRTSSFQIHDQTWVTKFFPESKFIHRAMYDYQEVNGERTGENVRIFFCDGTEMDYKMNEEQFKMFITAKSAGKHWHKFIKGNFNEKKIK